MHLLLRKVEWNELVNGQTYLFRVKDKCWHVGNYIKRDSLNFIDVYDLSFGNEEIECIFELPVGVGD